MKMRDRSRPLTKLFASACAFLLITGLTAGGLQAADKHLPAKARTVAKQFEEYQKTATPQAVETKRKQVITYLGKLLKNEAADANLEGALAVKALITKLSARPQSKSATGSEKVNKTTKAAAHRRDAVKLSTTANGSPTRFSINQESKRTLAFDFSVPAAPARNTIRFVINGASDDSGDNGLHYALIDPDGKIVARGFLSSSEDQRITHETGSSGGWQLQVNDADTSFDGIHPGNNGTVRITVISQEGTIASH